MRLIVSASLLSMSVSLAHATEQDINMAIEQLCSTEHMLIKHSVSIGQANAVAGNRAQHYQIQPSLSEKQKSQLTTSSISLGNDCLEFLSKKELLEVDADGVVARVYFNFDQSELTETSKITLTALAERIQSIGEVPNLNVVGHTDDVGSKDYNQKLGEHRAVTSKVYLVDSGVEKEILSPHSAGLEKPLKDNSTKEGRAANRRVEIVIADQS